MSFHWSRVAGGVLMRSGHTEACIDLCKLANLPPVGVLSELMNDDGTVMRGPEVAAFAEKHKLTYISIADLIAYRQSREKLVERVGEFPAASEVGTLKGYAYITPFDRVHHMAFVYGDIGDGQHMPARLHRADVIGDVLGGAKSICASLARFKAEGRGVIVYLRDGTAGVPVAAIPHDGDTGTDAGAFAAMARRRPRRANPRAISAFPRSACRPPASAPMSAWAVLASKSRRPTRSTADFPHCLSGGGLFFARAPCHHPPLASDNGKERHGAVSSLWCHRGRNCSRGF